MHEQQKKQSLSGSRRSASPSKHPKFWQCALSWMEDVHSWHGFHSGPQREQLKSYGSRSTTTRSATDRDWLKDVSDWAPSSTRQSLSQSGPTSLESDLVDYYANFVGSQSP
ncbi:hypothetical protein AMATHDRAFT_5717 [Amanita thiersii Skay4041]|uniref:Uncharacterized protein n=1 Tax=Amanita thiersii Skay4041 TaxID=703135 RepID=A0A2A9NEN2_9AGAR|nr:hypothetical protein AMATHDRAFT_5717 [Amanita thiersii Skay4041]